MKTSLKIILISVFLFLSAQGFALTAEYVPAFKPIKKNHSFSDMQQGIKRDFFQIQSLMSRQKNKMIGLMKDRKNKNTRNQTPTEI